MMDQSTTIEGLRSQLEQLRSESQRTTKVQDVLYRIAEAASASEDLAHFYAALHALVGELMYAGNFFIAVLDEQTGMLSWPYHVDEKDVAAEVWEPQSFQGDKGATSYVIRTGRSLHGATQYQPLMESGEIQVIGTVSQDAIFVPLRTNSGVLGTLAVQSYTEGITYTEDDVQVLTFVASHIATALTRARAIEETRRRNAELAIINSVGEAMARTLDVKTMTRIVGDKVLEIFGCELASILLLDAQTKLIHNAYVYDKEEGGYLDYLEPFPLGKGLTSRVITSRKGLRLGTVEEQTANGGYIAPEFEEHGATVIAESWLGVPIIVGETVLGIVNIGNYAPHSFDEADERLLQTLSTNMGVAIENARRFEAEQQRAAELAIINSVQQGLASKMEMQAIYDLVGNKIHETFPEAQEAGIITYDREADLFYPRFAVERGKRLEIPAWTPIGFRKHVLATRRTMVINRDAERLAAEFHNPVVAGERAKSFLFVPLLSGGEVTGIVELQHMDREDAFSESDVRLLETLASAMSVALENARLFDETQRLLKETDQRAAELQIINSVQEALASKLDMQGIYDLVGDKIRETFGADTAYIAIFDPKTSEFRIPYYVDQGKHLQPRAIPLGQGLTSEVYESRRPLLLHTVEEHKGASLHTAYADASEDLNQSYLGVPLVVGQTVTGVLSVQSHKESAFGDAQAQLLSTLANSMGVALENARLFEETQRLLKETEQRAAELAVINSVQEGLASKLDMQGIYDLVGDKIREIFNAQAVTIVSYDRTSELTRMHYVSEKGQRYYPDPYSFGDFDRFLMRTRQPLLIENWDAQMRELGLRASTIPGTEPTKSGIFVPLIVEGEIRGAITLQNVDREGAFSLTDVRLLTTLASSMSVALENARLFDETTRLLKETEQRAAELAVINSVQEGLASKLDFQSVIDLVGDKLRDLFRSDNLAIRLYDEATDTVSHPYIVDAGQRVDVPPQPLGKGFAAHVIRSRRPLLINRDLERTMAEYGSYWIGSVDQDYDRSHLGMPILGADRCLGVVALGSKQEDAFSEADSRLLQTVTNSLGVALENARLFDETQRLLKETEQRAAELAIINSVQEALASKLEIQAIYDLVGDKIREIFDAQVVLIQSFDHERRVRAPIYIHENGKRIRKAPELPFNPLAEHLIKSRQPVIVNEDMQAASKKYGLSIVPGTDEPRSVIFVPFGNAQLVNGYFSLQNLEREHAFSESDVRLLQTLAGSMGIALENARLFDEVQKRNQQISEALEQQTATGDILSVIAANPTDVQPVLDAVAEKAARLCGSYDAAVVRIEGPLFRIVAHWGPVPVSEQELANGSPMDRQTVTGRALLEGRLLHVHDVMAAPEGEYTLSKEYHTVNRQRTLLVAPLMREGAVIGGIVLRRQEVEPFSDKQIALLKTFADQAAIAVENVRLFNETTRLLKETEQRAAELQIINSVQEGLASKLDFQGVIDLVGDKVRSIIASDDLSIRLYDESTNTLRYPYTLDGGQREIIAPRPLTTGFTAHLIRTRQPLLINRDLEQRMAEYGSSWVGSMGAGYQRSFLGMPILAADRCLGVVALGSKQEDAFSESDLRLLQTITSSMGVALENARLFDETQRLLKETDQRAAELAIITRVQEGLASRMDMQSIYDLVGEKIRETFGADTAYIAVVDEARKQFDFPYYTDSGQPLASPPLAVGRGLTSEVYSTRAPLLLNSKTEMAQHDTVSRAYGDASKDLNQSFLGVPVLLGDRVSGVVSVQSHAASAYGDNDLRLLQTLANSMSVALENARLFDETQRLLKETEQRAAELQIINSVQEGLASKLDIQAIYDLVGDKIRDVFDAQSVLIVSFDHEQESRRSIYMFEDGQRVREDRPLPLNPLARQLISARQPVVINEAAVEMSAKYGLNIIPGTAAPKSMIFVPFGTARQVNGYFSLQNLDREHAFSDADVRLLQTLAGSMGIALENARLFEAERKRAAELSAINTVSEGLVAEADLERMIQLIGEQLRSIFNPDIAYVALLNRETNMVEFRYQHGDEMEPMPYGQGLTSKMLETGRPLLINRDIAKRRQELGTERVGKQAASYLGVPIMAGGEAIGAISVQSTEVENAFTEDDSRLLSTIAANAGAAIQTARLHTETQRRAQEMATLAEIGSEIAATRDLDPVLRRIAEHALSIMRVRDIAISLREDQGDKLRTRVALGRYSEQMKDLIIEPGRGILGDIVKRGQGEIVNTPESDPRKVVVPGTPEVEEDPECMMAAPLVSQGETIGSLTVWRLRREGHFSQVELDFLVSVARQTTIAIESARLYLETQRRANEMSALAEVGREISASLDSREILGRITERAQELLQSESSAVYLMEPDKKSMRAIVALGQSAEVIKADTILLGEGIIGTLAQQAQAEVINNAAFDPRAVSLPGMKEEELDSERMMAAPLLRGEDVIGMLVVWRTTAPFSQPDLNFLIGLARQAAIALENARLFDEVKRQGAYLETIFLNSPVAIVTVDDRDRVLSWSPAAEKLFGYASAEAMGRNVDDLVANSDEIRQEAASYTKQGKQHQYVHRVTRRTRKDGTLIDVDLAALPLPLEGGKTGVVAIYNDVGEIQRQRKYYEAIVQNSPVAIVTVDQDSKVVSWNPGAEQLFGYTREEAIGRNIDDMVAGTGAIHTEAEAYNQQARQRELHVITRRTRKDATLVDVELSGVPLPLPTGESGLVAIYHDITELQRARQEAVAANEAKSAFLATMSHEIRTPMNAVIGMSGLLMDTSLSQEQRDYAETIRNSGDALLTIINDILDFSKIEAGKMELENQPFELRECVESAVDLVAGRANEKGLDLAYIIEDDVPAGIRGDVTRLRQILLNLVSNAVKFTEKGEVVLTVGLGTQPEQLLFSVRDSGIGIAKNRMGRLFSSFSQADSSTTRRFGGTGLGLAISRRLAEMMGGIMWADSAGQGKGSTFSFTMRAPAVKVAPRRTVRELNGIQPALSGKRVLIVDDNATNRRILMLQTAKWGMAPRDTDSPREALRLLKSGAAFDLAIFDVQMPEMDGVTLAREVRKLKNRQALPMILLTSLGRKEAGADDLEIAAFLTKPLKPSSLFDALAGIFGGHGSTPRGRATKAGIDAGLAAENPLRILLAEDNAVNQKLALRLLEQMGYRADVASNGIEAVESVQRQAYDVVLMDVQMPEMDGLDATRAIRKIGKLTQPHIIAMTANAMQGDREMCLAAGMDDYVSKPIRVAELMEALRRARGSSRSAQAARTDGRPKNGRAKSGAKARGGAVTKTKARVKVSKTSRKK